MVDVQSCACDQCSSVIQTKKLSELLKKYWSVEILWFPFNSIVDRLLNMLPLVFGRTNDRNEIPEVTELRLSSKSLFASGCGDFVRVFMCVLYSHYP